METKEFEIQVPENYEIDKEHSTPEKIILRRIVNLPKSWEDLRTVRGYYVNHNNSKVEKLNEDFPTHKRNKNIFPTKEEAEACTALAQLCQLRDRYNGGWKPNWGDSTETKYCIEYYKEIICKASCNVTRKVLCFKTEEFRDRFLENLRDLIEAAKPLL